MMVTGGGGGVGVAGAVAEAVVVAVAVAVAVPVSRAAAPFALLLPSAAGPVPCPHVVKFAKHSEPIDQPDSFVC